MAIKKDNSTIHRMYKELVARASNIPNFEVGQIRDVTYDITELATSCVNARNNNDTFWSDVYFSALIVRYWHMVAKIYDKVKLYKISVEEVVTILYDSINKAMKYQSWLNEDKYISKDKKGAEKTINQCITSTVSNFITALNINSVKMFVENTDEDFDNSVSYNDSYDSSFGCVELVQKLIDKHDYTTAVIVDLIAYKDLTFQRILNNRMSKLSNDYLKSFMQRYDINDIKNFTEAVNNFYSSSSRERTRAIKNSLKYLKDNEDYVRSYLC